MIGIVNRLEYSLDYEPEDEPCCLTSRRSQPPLALAVPLSRFTSRVGGGSAFFVRRHSRVCPKFIIVLAVVAALVLAIYLSHFVSAHRTRAHQTKEHQSTAPSSYVGSLHEINAAKLSGHSKQMDHHDVRRGQPFYRIFVANLRLLCDEWGRRRAGGGIITIGRVGESASCLIGGRSVSLYH